MKKYIYFALILLILFGYIYHKNSLAERNSIAFVDNNKTVEDSLIKMSLLLSIFPKSTDGFNDNYDFNNGALYINRKFVGKEKFIKIENIKALTSFDDKQAKDFLSLSKFLNKNYLSCAYFEGSLNHWVFIYRQTSDQDFDDVRDIILIKEADSLKLKPEYKILDHKKEIFLIAPVEARIR